MDKRAEVMREDEELEIDLKELLIVLKQKLLVIIAAMLLGGSLCCAYVWFLAEPVYTSTSSLLVLTKETTLSSLADLQMGSQLTNDYRVLATSRPVLEEVIDKLGMEGDYTELREMITIENPSDTRILEITLEHSDPEAAQTIVNAVTETAASFIGEQMEVVPPKIIEEGELPTVRTGPSMLKFAAIGLASGLLLCSGVIILMAILDDTIKNEEDVERYLGLSVLASIPDRKDYVNTAEKKRSKKTVSYKRAADSWRIVQTARRSVPEKQNYNRGLVEITALVGN